MARRRSAALQSPDAVLQILHGAAQILDDGQMCIQLTARHQVEVGEALAEETPGLIDDGIDALTWQEMADLLLQALDEVADEVFLIHGRWLSFLTVGF
jgi:hypothetical protein